jgi:hypothetical protein
MNKAYKYLQLNVRNRNEGRRNSGLASLGEETASVDLVVVGLGVPVCVAVVVHGAVCLALLNSDVVVKAPNQVVDVMGVGELDIVGENQLVLSGGRSGCG